MHLHLLIGAPFLLTSAIAHADDLPIPSDPDAKYCTVQTSTRDDGLIELVTRRESKSGMWFVKRLVDCDKHTFKYLAVGESLDGMSQKIGQTMRELEPGSISHQVSSNVCGSSL